MEQVHSPVPTTGIVLSKYLSNSGLCARRKAEELIKKGAVAVNGTVITQWAYRVQDNDTITCHGKALNPQKEYIYIALNKPTEVITSAADDEGRKTVHDLVKVRGGARLFSVGRLDCMTTGLLLLTNDGELAQALAHPRFGVEKRYHITLSIPLRDFHKRMLTTGAGLPEGMVKPDKIITFERRPRECIVCIHSGQNRVVRKLFHSLGYAVHKLNRISYAGISTRGLPKGAWRKLTDEEVRMLKRKTSHNT